MKIKNIELCNWGRYQKANVPVDISNGKNLVLIRAINNTGKTSLFYAIRYAFYGDKGLRGHKNQNDTVDWINRQAAAKGDGQMYVELTIEHEGKDYRIQRTQKFYQTNTGQSIQPDGDEELQIFDQSKGGPSADAGKTNTTRDNWISSTLISLDASQFFFFDGEDIQQYTDQPKEAVKKAILRVLGIKVLTNAKTDLENTHYRELMHSSCIHQQALLQILVI